MPIRILAPEVANQIAAGEVVERPASVVKELVENSLDAGATDIRVEIREGGRRLVRVQDDGCGIPAAEVALAFQRHATSKIASAEDLTRLTTLGFRGEALASIAAVAQVTLLTRARAEEVGTLVRLAEGREIAREPRGAPVGTVVTVEHLFANVPARLKFLKQPATEAGHIQQIVTRFALAYPERRFSLVSDGRLLLQTSGSGKLYDVLLKVYGLEMARQMIAVGDGEDVETAEEAAAVEVLPFALNRTSSSTAEAIRVAGYVGAPTMHRSNRGYITLFVNRRWFQDATLAYAVIQAYHTLLPTGRYPVAVVFIALDPAEVDVNVHPTKAEVRFRDSQGVFRAVQRSVRRALLEQVSLPSVSLASDTSPAEPATSWGQARLPTSPTEEDWAARRAALLGAGSSRASVQPPAVSAAGAGTPGDGLAPSAPALSPPVSAPTAAGRSLLPLLRVVGQLGATYIVAEGPDGMYLIDQHAAHERILYEQMLAAYEAQQLAVQPLLEPVLLDLSPEQAAVVADALDDLKAVGIELEPFGGASYVLRALPAVLADDQPQSALAEVIDGLTTQTDVVDGTREAALVTLICKRAAVKAGQVLSMLEMQELVRRLEACRSPRTCPHGRPTMLHLSAQELARQFGRV